MKQTLRYQNEYTLSYAEYGAAAGYPILIQHGLIASTNDAGLFELRCTFEAIESDMHFSATVLDDFTKTVMLRLYRGER